MFDPENIITLYFVGDEALTQADVDQLSEWIGQSHENAVEFIRASFMHRAIHDSLAGEDLKKNVLLDLNEGTKSSYEVVMNSNVSLRGIDADDFMFDEKQSDGDDNQMTDVMLELLKMEKTAPAIEIPEEEPRQELIQKVVYPPHQKRKVSKLSLFTLAASAAAILFVALFFKFTPKPLPSMAVATLVDQMNTQWGDPAVSFENGSRLWTNDYSFNLKKGLLSIAYDQGVKVVVEGPAQFEVERSGIFLEYGRIYSQVSETGTGFTVNTPNSQCVDMGTEFGVLADIDGSSELHVTKGKVQLFAGTRGETKVTEMVTEDKAVRYDADSGLVKGVRIKKNAFVRKINSAFNQAWKGPSPYEQAVLETGPLYYWRFDEDRKGLLRDEMNPRLNEGYKLFGSLGYGNGLALDGDKNSALRLTGREKDYAVLRDITAEADSADGFSVAMWVCPEEADSAFKKNIVMRFKAESVEGVGHRRSLGFDDKNQFYFNALYDEGVEGARGRITIRSNPVAVNTWHHVAVTYTKNDRINIYVNGQLQATEELSSSFKPANINSQWCLGLSVIDTQYFPNHASFIGLIDEISHHDRELSAQEVEMLYEAVGQNNKQFFEMERDGND